MIKIIPLTKAILKEFLRNKRSLILITVLPIVFISLIFISFNPEGLKKIPIGFTSDYDKLDIEDYNDTYFSYLSIIKFGSLDDCIKELKNYNVYVCIHLVENRSLIINAYYDNTREPVIWEVIQRIKDSIDLLQKQKSKEIASDFFDRFLNQKKKIDDFKKNLIEVNSKVYNYIMYTDNSIKILKNAKKDLSGTLYDMDKDILAVTNIKNNIKEGKNNYKKEAYNSIAYVNSASNSFFNLTNPQDIFILNNINDGIKTLNYQLTNFDILVDDYLNQIDNKVHEYKDVSAKSGLYLNDINYGINKLEKIKEELLLYKFELTRLMQDLDQLQKELTDIQDVNPELIVNPLILYNKPVYTPKLSKELEEKYLNKSENGVKDVVKGINLISLQTIFPTILLLITLFLSLLISSFICLNEINSSSYQRRRLINDMFIPEIIAVYLSSIIIMIVPLLCVIFVGNFIFKLPLISNLFFIVLLLVVLSSIFILFGQALSYLIKKESITLLITTFILTFMIFFSGFLLPIERMSHLAGTLAPFFPVKLTLNSFNKLIFYDLNISSITMELSFLIIWLLTMSILVIGIKKYRNL